MNWLLNFLFGWLFKPYSVSNLNVKLEFILMKVARVRVFWDLSRSPDVVSQRVEVVNQLDDSVIADLELDNVTSEVVFDVPEKTAVSVRVTASDGTFESDPAVLTVDVGDLTRPEAVTGLDWEILEVVDPEVVE